MIIQSFQNRLKTLKANNNHIQFVLDIGAYRGDFTETIKSVWSSCIVYQFEADERQKHYLQPNAIFALLGNEDKSDVTFYTLDNDKITTGSSIFLENTQHYTSASTVVLKKPMYQLDTLSEQYKFAGDFKNYGLIKIDTQGSELLILDGAKKFLADRNPRYILLECSVIDYNINAPKINEVIIYMDSIGYNVKDIFDVSYNNNGMLMQTDLLFERKT